MRFPTSKRIKALVSKMQHEWRQRGYAHGLPSVKCSRSPERFCPNATQQWCLRSRELGVCTARTACGAQRTQPLFRPAFWWHVP